MTTLSIPDHKEVAKGTLRSLIRSAGLRSIAFPFSRRSCAGVELLSGAPSLNGRLARTDGHDESRCARVGEFEPPKLW